MSLEVLTELPVQQGHQTVILKPDGGSRDEKVLDSPREGREARDTQGQLKMALRYTQPTGVNSEPSIHRAFKCGNTPYFSHRSHLQQLKPACINWVSSTILTCALAYEINCLKANLNEPNEVSRLRN